MVARPSFVIPSQARRTHSAPAGLPANSSVYAIFACAGMTPCRSTGCPHAIPLIRTRPGAQSCHAPVTQIRKMLEAQREPQLTTHRRAQIWNCARQDAASPEQPCCAERHWDMQLSVQLRPSARRRPADPADSGAGIGVIGHAALPWSGPAPQAPPGARSKSAVTRLTIKLLTMGPPFYAASLAFCISRACSYASDAVSHNSSAFSNSLTKPPRSLIRVCANAGSRS